MRRILMATLVASSLVLAACSGSDSGGSDALDDITVSSAKTPKVTVPEDFSVKATVNKTITPGSGDTLEEDDSVKVNYIAINGRTGEEFDNSYTSGTPLTLTLNETSVLPGFVKGLAGQKVGSRVLAAIPPKDGFNAAQEQLQLRKDDTMVFVFDIIGKVATEATGKSAALPSDLPEIQFDGDNHPSGFVATDKTKDEQTKASAHVVIQGDGAKLEAGQTLTAQYVGQVYPDGAVFDESWTSGARSFQVGAGALIQCWDDLLVGQKLGTRVVLVCPADTAYGDNPQEGGAIEKGDTLIFAVDLLDAS